MDLLDDALRRCRFKILPSLIELNVSVSVIIVPGKESLNVLKGALRNELLIWLVGSDQVRDACFTLIEQFRKGNSRFLATSSCTHLGDRCVVDHVVVAHQDLCL